MTYNNYEPQVDNGLYWSDDRSVEPIGVYTAKTFGWMALGLLATFAVAFATWASGLWLTVLVQMPMIPFLLAIAEIAVVFFLSARIKSMSIGTARGMFFLYAVLNGLTFSSFFVLYDVASLIIAFGMTALYFGVLAAYGYVTKRDLSNLAPILTSGLIFLVIFWVLSIFLPLSGFEKLVCFIGVAIFMGYTAYDTQKIKQFHQMYGGNPELAGKASILCALQLYLDFINLFLYILRLLGRPKDNPR